MDGKREFPLSEEELEYLKELASGDESLASLFSRPERPPGRRPVIRLSTTEAEQIRDHLTTRLAMVGFDKDYSPNAQGQLLEELIDRFYIR